MKQLKTTKNNGHVVKINGARLENLTKFDALDIMIQLDEPAIVLDPNGKVVAFRSANSNEEFNE